MGEWLMLQFWLKRVAAAHAGCCLRPMTTLNLLNHSTRQLSTSLWHSKRISSCCYPQRAHVAVYVPCLQTCLQVCTQPHACAAGKLTACASSWRCTDSKSLYARQCMLQAACLRHTPIHVSCTLKHVFVPYVTTHRCSMLLLVTLLLLLLPGRWRYC